MQLGPSASQPLQRRMNPPRRARAPRDHAIAATVIARPRPPPAMRPFTQLAETIGWIVDLSGVAIIVLGLLYAVGRFVIPGGHRGDRYRRFREDIGRGILLGLEFLVAADIIRTVAVAPTLSNVLVLGLIVLIRTFLSMALQVELEGRWPWERHGTHPRAAGVASRRSAAEDAKPSV